jgi:hypothetical protein
MRRIYAAFVAAAAAVTLLVVIGTAESGSQESDSVVLIVEHVNVGSTCNAPNADIGGYSLTGFNIPASITYKFNTRTFPAYISQPDFYAAVDAGFAAWDSETSRALFFNGGTVTKGKIGGKDGTSLIGFGKTSGTVVATVYTWYNTKKKILLESDVMLSNALQWSTNPGATGDCGGETGKYDVQNTITHEVGHMVGLRDLTATSQNAQTMYSGAASRELFKRTLSSGDLAGLHYLYGP